MTDLDAVPRQRLVIACILLARGLLAFRRSTLLARALHAAGPGRGLRAPTTACEARLTVQGALPDASMAAAV